MPERSNPIIVASFCIDEDMSVGIADELGARGHDAVSAKREGDFKLLHRAWLRWPLTQPHTGILVVRQRYALSDAAIVVELDRFAASGTSVRNRLFLLQQRPPGGLRYAWEEWVPPTR